MAIGRSAGAIAGGGWPFAMYCTRVSSIALALLGLGCSPVEGARGVNPPQAVPSARAAQSPASMQASRAGAQFDLPRFVSVNIPNLHYIEDDFTWEHAQRYRLPDEFEIRDALAAVQQMHGSVVRIYALSVRKANDAQAVPRHVLGPGQFDEAAFQTLDRVFALAREYGVKIILPFVDNWSWWGGVAEYAAFRGMRASQFWSDPQLISDFEATLAFVTQRRNSITGVRYCDDPTLLAWETGNELQAPWSWTEQIAQYLKQLDPNHPIVDGIHSRFVRKEALESPYIDILTTHHYTSAAEMRLDISENLEFIRGRKPYFIGEFGFLRAGEVAPMLRQAMEGGALGVLAWSLRFRNRDGGFYWHAEAPGFAAYRFPGFDSGAGYDERAVLAELQDVAKEVQAPGAAPLLPPPVPVLLPLESPYALTWRGSVGATGYQIERAVSSDGPWQIIARGISDAEFGYRPLFADTTVELGAAYYYRLRAESPAGLSEYSAAQGPVSATLHRFIDELTDLTHVTSHSGEVRQMTDEPLAARMERGRVAGRDGKLVYRLPGGIRRLRVDSLLRGDAPQVVLEVSSDGRAFSRAKAQVTEFPPGTDQSAIFRAVRLHVEPPPGTQVVRIGLGEQSQVARVEIDYAPK